MLGVYLVTITRWYSALRANIVEQEVVLNYHTHSRRKMTSGYPQNLVYLLTRRIWINPRNSSAHHLTGLFIQLPRLAYVDGDLPLNVYS